MPPIRNVLNTMTDELNLKCIPAYRLLTVAQIERLHQATLELLERVGMARATPRVLDACLAAGCSLTDGGRLCFPRAVVEQAMASK